MAVKTLDDLLGEGVSGRRVLVRADLNVPFDGEKITDDGRVRAALPTIRAVAEAGARVIVTAHLGRPKGAPDPAYSLRPVAARLGELLGTEVPLAGDVVGDQAKAAVSALGDGDVVLLENVRFDPRETSKSESERAQLARELAELTGGNGAFVSDGFGVVHRKQASVYDVARVLPPTRGLVLAELDVLKTLTGDPNGLTRWCSVGRRCRTNSPSSRRCCRRSIGCSSVVVCASPSSPRRGTVSVPRCWNRHGGHVQTVAGRRGDKLMLPTDVVVADAFSADAATRTVPITGIEDG